MRVFVKSFGCSANLADGETMAGCLAEAGYELTKSASEAELVIYNTCGVKGPTENRIINALRKVPKNKKVIVAGCLPLISFERLSKEVRFEALVGPATGKSILETVNRVRSGEKVVSLKGALESKPDLALPRLRLNPIVGIIPVNYGCLGSCSYCCVVHARGKLRSYPITEILKRVKTDVAHGTKEFWITSQDTACYGRDIHTNLAELLKTLAHVEGDFKMRVGMMTPNLVLDIQSDLIRAIESPKLFKFVHLPVQSGADDTLKLMRRFYRVQDFKEAVNAFRTSFPNITLATDVICGFPGESIEDFEDTLRLVEEIKPDIVNVSKFFARPQTAAAKMHENFVDPTEIKRRSSLLAALAKKISLERNKRWTSWIGEILIDEEGKIPDSWIGRNFAYKPIVVKSPKVLLGQRLRVKVTKAHPTYLLANIIG